MLKITLVLFVLLAFIACSEEYETDKDSFKYYSVVLGHVCGWCAGADSLWVTAEALTYTKIMYCEDSTAIQKKPYSLNELNQLLELLDIDDFMDISINTCNVCVDGCDTWITVQKGTLHHTIRFGYRDSAVIRPILPFVEALHDIQAEFLNN